MWNWGNLVSDSPQKMAIEGAGRSRTRKRNSTYPQLSGEFLIDDTGICPGVNEGGQGMGTLWKEEPGVEMGSLGGGRTRCGLAH